VVSGKPRSVAVVGASSDRRKFGNKAVRAYRAGGYAVFPVNPNEKKIEGLTTYARIGDVPGPIDRVTVYVPPEILLDILPEIAEKGAGELYLNPGTDREDVVERARSLGLEPILACSIVAIGFSPSEFPDTIEEST